MSTIQNLEADRTFLCGFGQCSNPSFGGLARFPVPGTGQNGIWLPIDGTSESQQCVQIMDATTDRIHLRSGDLIVVSTEGVARAYEVECGAPIYYPEMATFRQAQIEDYVKA